MAEASRAKHKFAVKRNSWPKTRGVAMNPVDHVRCHSYPHYVPRGHSNLSCSLASWWWKPPAYWKSFDHLAFRSPGSKGRSYCGPKNWTTAWHAKDQGLIVEALFLEYLVGFAMYHSIFDTIRRSGLCDTKQNDLIHPYLLALSQIRSQEESLAFVLGIG